VAGNEKRATILVVDGGFDVLLAEDAIAGGRMRAFSRRQVNDVSSTCSRRATAGRRRYGAKIDAVG